MAIVSNQEILDFLGITDSFVISSFNNEIYFKYNSGSATKLTLTAGTYTSTELSSHLKSKIDTAFSLVSTVSYDSSTRKFTITVPSNTIQYINSGSIAGLLFGFTEDSSVSISIISDSQTSSSDAYNQALDQRDFIEAQLQKECRRNFESQTYILERYSGTGSRKLFLRNYPITSIQRIAIGTLDMIRITNTNTGTIASVSVNSTGIVLNRDGSVDSTLLFSDNLTLSAMVTAINAVGNGWAAELLNSLYSNYKSDSLIKKFGLSTIDTNYVYLQIPYDAEYDFEVDDQKGIIYHNISFFNRGFNNIFVTYTAGYSSVDMPDDLKMAIKILTKLYYEKNSNNTYGLQEYKVGDIAYRWLKDSATFPMEVQNIISKYRKIML